MKLQILNARVELDRFHGFAIGAQAHLARLGLGASLVLSDDRIIYWRRNRQYTTSRIALYGPWCYLSIFF